MEQLADYVRYYVGRLSSPMAEDADDAWHSLVEAGSSALPHVVDAFYAAGDDGIKVSLIEVVGQYRSAEAVPFLNVLLRDLDGRIWKPALDSLVMIGGQEALDALAIARTMAPPDRREWITEGIQQVNDRRRPG